MATNSKDLLQQGEALLRAFANRKPSKPTKNAVSEQNAYDSLFTPTMETQSQAPAPSNRGGNVVVAGINNAARQPVSGMFQGMPSLLLNSTPGRDAGQPSPTSDAGMFGTQQAEPTMFSQPERSIVDQAQQAAGIDFRNAVDSQQQRFDRGQRQIGLMEDALAGVDDAEGNALIQAGRFAKKAEDVFTPGRSRELGKSITSAVGGDVDRSNRLADAAIETTKQTASLYDTDANKFAASRIREIEDSFKSRLEMLAANLDENGNPMLPSQRLELQSRMAGELARTKEETLTSIQFTLQNTLAGLRTNIASTQMQAAELALRNSGVKLDAAAKSAALQADYDRAAVDSQRLASEMATTAKYYALDARIKGRAAIAQMVEQNAYSPVSVLGSFATLASLAVAPKAGETRAISRARGVA